MLDVWVQAEPTTTKQHGVVYRDFYTQVIRQIRSDGKYPEYEHLTKTRLWTSKNGDYQVSAMYWGTKLFPPTLILKRPAANVIEVKLEDLSEDSLKHLAEIKKFEDRLNQEMLAMSIKAAGMPQTIAKHQAELDEKDNEIAELMAELAKYKPSDSIKKSDKYEQITAERFRLFEEKYEDKKVSLIGARIRSFSPLNDLEVKFGRQDLKPILELRVVDSKGAGITCYADRDTWGDFIIDLEDDEKLNIAGVVMAHPIGRFRGLWLVVTKMEKSLKSE